MNTIQTKETNMQDIILHHYEFSTFSEKIRTALGLKQLATDIWDDFFSRHHVGDTIEGKVVRMTNFGAFVELDDGIRFVSNLVDIEPADVRNEMIDEGVPKDRVSVLTAAGVRRKFGAIKWGTGRPSVRTSDKNGKRRRRATGPEFYARRRAEVYASWKRNLAEGNTLAAAGDYECLRREFGIC